MLQTIRDNMKGAVAMFIVAIMIIPFALFGIDSLFLRDSTAGEAAKVNGQAIAESALSQAIRVQKQQLLERFGEQAPVELLSDERLRGPVLQRLIQRELLSQSATNGSMTVSDGALDQLIISSPQFQRDGKFDPQLFTQLLRMQGYTPAIYKGLLLEDMLINQHATALSDSAFSTQADIERLTALTQQERDFQFVTLEYGDSAASVHIEDSEVQSFYDANQASFMSREQVSIDYIEVSLSKLAATVEVSDEQVQQQFKQEQDSFVAQVQRQAAHILIESKDDGSEQSVITEVLAKLEAGEDFSELAKTYSDDLGSRAFGGDLGSSDGTTFPDAFEVALGSLEPGQVSAPTETEAGTHFIKLVSEERTQAPSFEGVAQRIKADLAKAAAESLYLEILEELPEATYNADDLEFAAEELGLEVASSALFGREGGVGVLASNQVLAAVFSDEVLNDGQVSDVLELSDSTLIVLKRKEHMPSVVKPVLEVTTDIIEQLTREKTETLLADKAAKYISELETGRDIEVLAEEHGLSWQVQISTPRQQAGIADQLLQHVFSLPHSSTGTVNSGIQLSDGDYVVVQLSKVTEGRLPDLPTEQLEQFKGQLAEQLAQLEFSLYQRSMEAGSDVIIH